MKYRKLGKYGVKISEISLGSWNFGSYVDKENAIKSIHKAYELGINFFDTANVYGRGDSEKVVGEALQDFPRDSYVLSTKVFGKMGDGPNDQGLSRKHIFEQIDASLKRLKLDYVDIYYIHRFDDETPMEETFRALDDLIRQGKVLYIGVSMWKDDADKIVEALRVQDKYLLDHIVVNQPVYHLFNRNIEKNVVPVCQKNGIGLTVYSPLAQGLLTGKYRKGQDIPEGSRAAHKDDSFARDYLTEEKLEKVEKLIAVAKELDITLPQLALAWILHQPGITSALIGASKPEQVAENVKAVDVELSDETLAEIEEIMEK